MRLIPQMPDDIKAEGDDGPGIVIMPWMLDLFANKPFTKSEAFWWLVAEFNARRHETLATSNPFYGKESWDDEITVTGPALAEAWGWNVGKVHYWLRKLEREGFVVRPAWDIRPDRIEP